MVASAPVVNATLDEPTRNFYLRSLDLLDHSGIPYLVGGAYSLAYHAGIARHTKDLDVFVRPADAQRTLAMFAHNGYRTELTFPHWLGKAFDPADADAFVDVIFASGNGLCTVDEKWFTHAVQGEALGRPALLCPAEEIIWSKSFVMERERYDGADIHHILLWRGKDLDYQRLLWRFTGNERVLLAHLTMFGYVFPGQRGNVPAWVMDELIQRLRNEPAGGDHLCRGTLVSRQQYLIDVHERGFIDGRLPPSGRMTQADVDYWTDAIGKIK